MSATKCRHNFKRVGIAWWIWPDTIPNISTYSSVLNGYEAFGYGVPVVAIPSPYMLQCYATGLYTMMQTKIVSSTHEKIISKCWLNLELIPRLVNKYTSIFEPKWGPLRRRQRYYNIITTVPWQHFHDAVNLLNFYTYVTIWSVTT